MASISGRKTIQEIAADHALHPIPDEAKGWGAGKASASCSPEAQAMAVLRCWAV
jgi:hypothetical protein